MTVSGPSPDPRRLDKPDYFALHPLGFSAAMHAGRWRGVVQVVHDGDTLSVLTDKGFYDVQFVKLRLVRVDTPEMHDPDPAVRVLAQAARDWLAAMVLHRPVAFRPIMSRVDQERMSFDRYLADVWYFDGQTERNLSDALLEAGHARLYMT